jgi:putative sigma-54 modulation protein
MNIALTFKNFEPSDHLRQYTTRRFEKLRRFVHKTDNVEITIVLTVDKFRHKADVQFVGNAVSFSAVEQSSDMYATVDMVLDKIESQLKKHAERMKEKRRGSGDSKDNESAYSVSHTPDVGAAANELLIVEEAVEPKPMFAEEAVLQLAQREDILLVFLNAENERINVVYRRKQGGFGLIDPGIY